MKKPVQTLLLSGFLLTFMLTKTINVMQDTKEVWKAIPGFDGYEASTLGEIRSTGRLVNSKNGSLRLAPSKILTGHKSNCGYYRVGIQIRVLKTISIHRLVAITFIPNPENKRTVNHKDGDKSNNKVSNLEWSTHKENVHHSIILGIKAQAKGIQFINRSKLDELQVRVIKSIGTTIHPKDIAGYFNISYTSIYDILNGRTWKHIL